MISEALVEKDECAGVGVEVLAGKKLDNWCSNVETCDEGCITAGVLVDAAALFKTIISPIILSSKKYLT